MDLVHEARTVQAPSPIKVMVDPEGPSGVSRCRLPCWERRDRWETAQRGREAGRELHELYLALASVEEVPRRAAPRILEWGVGTGDNARAFAPSAERYYGVDRSSEDLTRCARQLQGSSVFQPVMLQKHSPEAALLHLEQPVDLFLSTGAFQRFPREEQAALVLKVAHHALSPGGVALIQTRFHDGSEYVQPPSVPSFKVPRRPVTYRLDALRALAKAAGLSSVRVLVNPPSRSAFYLFRKEVR